MELIPGQHGKVDVGGAEGAVEQQAMEEEQHFVETQVECGNYLHGLREKTKPFIFQAFQLQISG